MEDTMSRYRTLEFCIAAAAMLVCVLVPDVSIAQARKATLKELTETSTAIITGKCEKKESYWNETRTKIFTKVTIRTGEAIKGNAAALTVVTVPGGQVGTTLYDVSDMPSFKVGEEVLVFLWNHPSGQTLVTGALQGKHTIVEEKSTGKKVVQGTKFLIEEDQQQKTIGLQKTSEKGAEQKAYLDDVKQSIRKYVGK
jgi:hypothetical protein